MNKNTRTFVLGLILLACGAGIFYYERFDILGGMDTREFIRLFFALAMVVLGMLKVLKTTD